MTILSEHLYKAKKNYSCDACYVLLTVDDIRSLCNNYSFTIAEKRALIKARDNDFMIKKGDTYLYQVGIYDGEFQIARAIPEIHQINIKHEIYEE